VLVLSVSGLHSGVNAISGDVSVGASGIVIRDGVLAEPIREFTLATTVQRLLSEVVEVGADEEWLPMRATGVSVLVDGVTISGTS